MTQYNLFRFLLVSSLMFLLSACGDANQKAPCEVEEFNPIFPKDLPALQHYKFEVNEQRSIENFRVTEAFPIPIEVEIIQLGCHDFTQELRFEIMDKIPPQLPAKECTQIVMGIFNYFANLHPDLMTFGAFIQVMEKRISEFEYNTAVELQDGFSMKIDKMHSTASTTLIVTIKQQKED